MRLRALLPACLALVLLVLLVAPSRAQGSYDPSVFTPNGVVYELKGDFTVVLENRTENFMEERKGNITLVLTLFSRDQGGGYQAWSMSVYLEKFYYNKPEEFRTLLDVLRLNGIAIPPLVAVKEGTRETYFLVDFHQLKKALEETNVTGTGDLVALANKVMAATGEVNEEVYFMNPFFIPLDVGVGTEIIYGVYNKTSHQQLEVRLRIDDDGPVEAAGGTYDAWIIRMDEDEVADILAGLGLDEEGVRAIRSVDVKASIYYDKASGWLLGYELHSHATNRTTIEHEGRTIIANATGDVDVVFKLVEPGTVNVGGKTILERTLHLPRNSGLAFSAGLLALSAYLGLRRPRGEA